MVAPVKKARKKPHSVSSRAGRFTNRLIIFLAVFENGGAVAAAADLGISREQVLLVLRELKNFFGQEIFEKREEGGTWYSADLTEFGEELVELARDARYLVERLDELRKQGADCE